MEALGIWNQGNQCWLNTALQMLFSAPSVCAYFDEGKGAGDAVLAPLAELYDCYKRGYDLEAKRRLVNAVYAAKKTTTIVELTPAQLMEQAMAEEFMKRRGGAAMPDDQYYDLMARVAERGRGLTEQRVEIEELADLTSVQSDVGEFLVALLERVGDAEFKRLFAMQMWDDGLRYESFCRLLTSRPFASPEELCDDIRRNNFGQMVAAPPKIMIVQTTAASEFDDILTIGDRIYRKAAIAWNYFNFHDDTTSGHWSLNCIRAGARGELKYVHISDEDVGAAADEPTVDVARNVGIVVMYHFWGRLV